MALLKIKNILKIFHVRNLNFLNIFVREEISLSCKTNLRIKIKNKRFKGFITQSN